MFNSTKKVYGEIILLFSMVFVQDSYAFALIFQVPIKLNQCQNALNGLFLPGFERLMKPPNELKQCCLRNDRPNHGKRPMGKKGTYPIVKGR